MTETKIKILFISMPSIHFTRWIENLKDTPYELFWFDVLTRGTFETEASVTQITGWKLEKRSHLSEEKTLKKYFPRVFAKLRSYAEVSVTEALLKAIRELQPDLVHSFEMQHCSYPILKTMRKFPKLPWVYSCWGSDLYYYKQFPKHLTKIKKTLGRIDHLVTDNLRDHKIAKDLGFSGGFFGPIPGGGGYAISQYEALKKPPESRKKILIKGYEHTFGRGLHVVKTLAKIHTELQDYEVVVFGAHKSVIDYINNEKLPFKVYNRHFLSHMELIESMGKSLVYIGNSISDGIPNTLLEAMCMEVFPIQSNPGGVTEELITHGKNGLLISNVNSETELIDLTFTALKMVKENRDYVDLNLQIARERLDYEVNRTKILGVYKAILKS
tara:strand:+ start:89678 stop:90832 length:1155 start_codon:yes stop_codon:yes gene_type:complete